LRNRTTADLQSLEHLLRLPLRLHARSPALRPSRHRKRHRHRKSTSLPYYSPHLYFGNSLANFPPRRDSIASWASCRPSWPPSPTPTRPSRSTSAPRCTLLWRSLLRAFPLSRWGRGVRRTFQTFERRSGMVEGGGREKRRKKWVAVWNSG